MTLAVFLELKAERQLIPAADRNLSEPPIIPQQIHPPEGVGRMTTVPYNFGLLGDSDDENDESLFLEPIRS